MVWRLAGLTFDVDSTEANGHLLAVIGQPTNFNFGADCFQGCGVEGLKIVCVLGRRLMLARCYCYS